MMLMLLPLTVIYMFGMALLGIVWDKLLAQMAQQVLQDLLELSERLEFKVIMAQQVFKEPQV
jgi:hypothetical protein